MDPGVATNPQLQAGHRRRLAAVAEAGQGDFPRPLRIGSKTVRWRLSDVEAYLAALAGEGR
jgi:hypothetical protein